MLKIRCQAEKPALSLTKGSRSLLLSKLFIFKALQLARERRESTLSPSTPLGVTVNIKSTKQYLQ